MRYLLTVILSGGFMMIQQPTWNPQPMPMAVHQPMPYIQPGMSNLDKFRNQMNQAVQESERFRLNAEEIRRAEDQSED